MGVKIFRGGLGFLVRSGGQKHNKSAVKMREKSAVKMGEKSVGD
jgi:hypothetical protein